MTKKDYELIARAINGTRYDSNGLNGLAYLLCAEFERLNPKFNRNKFLELCGIDTCGCGREHDKNVPGHQLK